MFEHVLTLFMRDANLVTVLKNLIMGGRVCEEISVAIYRVSQEECARLREVVPYVKVYRYNPKHLCPKLNG